MLSKLLTLLSFAPILAFSQTECNPTQQITTNPISPVNTQRSSMLNHFDWTQSSFPLRAEQLTSSTMVSPFYQGPWNSRVANITDSKDRLPIDGWELINADFGYNIDGTPSASKVIDPKLLLYNKYTGTFRLFFAKGHTSTNDYNFIKIVLKFTQDAGDYNFNTLELSNGGILKPVEISDAKTNPGQFQFMDDFQQTPGNWVYTDFPMHYDPCTCLFKSKIKVMIRYQTNANIDLTGSFNGKLAAITNGVGSVTNPDGFSANFKDLGTTVQTINKAYKTIDEFYSDLKKINPTNATALSNMASDLKLTNFLKAGFSAVPYLNLAVGFLNFFSSGGNSSAPTQVALTPTSIDLSGKITGTLQSDISNVDGVLITPGSDTSTADNTKYPVYNQPMGVIAITKVPKIRWYKSVLEDNSSDCCFTDVVRNDVLFDRASGPVFEYALNPASGLSIQEAEASLIFEYHDPYHLPNSNTPQWTKGYYDRPSYTYHPILVYEGYDSVGSNYRFRSDYFPVECLAGKVLSFETQNTDDIQSTDNISHVYLKVKFNLTKNNGTGQNVLLVQTYDITSGISSLDWDMIRNVPYIPDPSTSKYANKPEPELNTCNNSGSNSNFVPITSTRLSSICNSTFYTDKHKNLSSSHIDSLKVAPDISGVVNLKNPDLSGKIFPNPANNIIKLVINKTNIKVEHISIRNASGLMFYDFVKSIEVNGKETTITCQVSQLPPGAYFISVKREDNQLQSFKFIKN